MALYTIIIIAVLLIIIVFLIRTYNKMVKNRNQVNEAWSIIDVSLKKRYDLIPNLVNVVKGYSKHENETLTEITRMRSQAMQSTDIKDRVANETRLDNVLAKLFVSVENYPDLKANENYIQLQKQISEIENDIEKSRRYYNGTVRENNIYIESFPSNLVAGIFGFQKESFFQINSDSREVPVVSL